MGTLGERSPPPHPELEREVGRQGPMPQGFLGSERNCVRWPHGSWVQHTTEAVKKQGGRKLGG